MAMMSSRTLSVSIASPPDKVYEVILTLFRLPDMTDEKYAEDSKMVEQDLKTLKDIFEK